MLELTLVFIIFTCFFTVLYFKLDKSQKEHTEGYLNKTEETPVPWVSKFNKNFVFFFAVLSLVSCFYSAMLGEPNVTTSWNATIANHTFITLINNGPSAGNLTTQNYPVITNTTRTVTTSFNPGQTNVINNYYIVILLMLFVFAVLETIIFFYRWIAQIRDQWKRNQEGDYD